MARHPDLLLWIQDDAAGMGVYLSTLAPVVCRMHRDGFTLNVDATIAYQKFSIEVHHRVTGGQTFFRQWTVLEKNLLLPYLSNYYQVVKI